MKTKTTTKTTPAKGPHPRSHAARTAALDSFNAKRPKAAQAEDDEDEGDEDDEDEAPAPKATRKSGKARMLEMAAAATVTTTTKPAKVATATATAEPAPPPPPEPLPAYVRGYARSVADALVDLQKWTRDRRQEHASLAACDSALQLAIKALEPVTKE